MIASLVQDVRYAFRQLRKSPGFTATAVTVLALGLGANIAVFTLISGIFLRPLPYADAGQIVSIRSLPMENGFFVDLNYSNEKQLIDAIGSNVQTAVVFEQQAASVIGPGGHFQVSHEEVTVGFANMLGVEPILGRSFRPEENDPGHEHVVLLSAESWRNLYNSDHGVIGKSLQIRGRLYTIVGVMPKGFSFPFGDEQQIWTPAPLNAAARTAMDGERQLSGSLYARLPQGMTAAQLAANVNRMQPRIAQESTNTGIPKVLEVIGYQRSLNANVREPLTLLYAVVFGIWVLACLNVTSLMLARALSRSREQAVRAALGASRARLLQQSIVESLLLSGIGGVLGLLAGEAAIKLLWASIERKLPMTSAIHAEWRVFLGLAVLTVLTACVVGLYPAFRANRHDVQGNLQGTHSTASANQHRAREFLVIAQLAITLVFLVGAGLFLRTIHNLRQVPLGFTSRNVLTGGIVLHPTISPREKNDNSHESTDLVQTVYMPLLERVRSIPGVRNAALSSVLPMRAEFAVSIRATLDHKKVPEAENPLADGRLASSGLVEALGIPMVRGRFFTDSDTASSPVVVVINQAFANRYLKEQDPVGHVISMGDGRFNEAHIVGVIGDVKQTDLTKETKPEIYFCLPQITPGTALYGIATAFTQVAIRGNVPADALRAQFDRALHEVAPDATTTDVKTIHEAVEDSFGSQTLTSYLLEGFAVLALFIASVGLYGLLSFAVAQRTREIGLRLALGAQKGNIFTMVLLRACFMIGCGLICGSVVAWFAVSLMRGYLFGVQAHDAITFLMVPLVLASAALLASWVPAQHAASIEPTQALRTE